MFRSVYLGVFFLALLQLGTTYVLKEAGVEIARWTEEDGSDAIEEINADADDSSEAVAVQDDIEPEPIPGINPQKLFEETIQQNSEEDFETETELSVADLLADPLEETQMTPPLVEDLEPSGEMAEPLFESQPFMEDPLVAEPESVFLEPLPTEPEASEVAPKNDRMRELVMEESMIKEMTQVQADPREEFKRAPSRRQQLRRSYAKIKPRAVKTKSIASKKVQEVPSVFKPKRKKIVEIEETPLPEIQVEKPEPVKAPPAEGQGYAKNWEENENGYQTVIQTQEATGEPVILYFHSEDSPYCKRFDRDVLSKKETQQFLTDFVKVKIGSGADRSLYDQYHVKDYPTILVQLKSGKVVPVYERSNAGFFIQEVKRAVAYK